MYNFVNMSSIKDSADDEKSWDSLKSSNFVDIRGGYADFVGLELKEDGKFIKFTLGLYGRTTWRISKTFILDKLSEYYFVLSLDGYNFFKELISKKLGESHPDLLNLQDSLFLRLYDSDELKEINYHDYNICVSILNTDESFTNVIKLINVAKKRMLFKIISSDLYDLFQGIEEDESSLFSFVLGNYDSKQISKERMIEILNKAKAKQEAEKLAKENEEAEDEQESEKLDKENEEAEDEQESEELAKENEEAEDKQESEILDKENEEAEDEQESEKLAKVEEITNKYNWKSFFLQHWWKILICFLLVFVIFFVFDDIKYFFSGSDTKSINTNDEIIEADMFGVSDTKSINTNE